MAYCTLDDLKLRVSEAILIALTDDEGLGSINTTRAQEAIDQASDEMDLYLGKVCKLPIDQASLPPALKRICADIAIYHLYARRKEEIPELRSQRYKDAIRLLEQINAGKISIGLEPPPEAPPNRDVLVSAREQIFSEDTMEKF